MAGLTVQEIINQIRKDISDTGEDPTYSDQQILTKGFNAFGRDIAELSNKKEISTVLTTVNGTTQYAYPDSKWWFPVFAHYDENGNNNWIPLQILKISNAQSADIFDTDDKGAPRFVYILDDKINVYPVPDATYTIKMVIIKKFTKITIDDLEDDFEDHFDSEYEDYIQLYSMSKVLKASDRQAIESHSRFNELGGPWDRIKRIELKKLEPFNAKNRRTRGVQSINNTSDYGMLI